MSRGQALRGIAASTACTRSRVVRSGRRATMNCAIRCDQRSSPYWRRIRWISAASYLLTMFAAVRGDFGSMRISSGPSARKLNPRSGSSSCALEMPKSERIMSAASKPAGAARSPTSPQLPPSRGPAPDHPRLGRGLDPRRRARFRRERDPSLAVGFEAVGQRVERPCQRSLVRPLQWRPELVRQRRPHLGRIDREHPVQAYRDEAALRQLLAEAGRDCQPPFLVHADPLGTGEHSPGLPVAVQLPLLARAEAATAAVQLEREPDAGLVEPAVQRRPAAIAAVGRGGVEEVYCVPY